MKHSPSQRQVLSVHQMDFCTHAIEDARELHRNVASANDEDGSICR